MRSLDLLLAGEFESKVRARGGEYYRSGMVSIQVATRNLVQAIVTGSQAYAVDLSYENGDLRVFCQCPYFGDEGACKHLWAAILAADARHALLDALTGKRVTYSPDWERDEDAFIDDTDEDFESEFEPKRRARTLPVVHESTPRWKQRISAISTEPAYSLARATRDWPPGRELLYILNAQLSLTAGHMVVETAQREPKLKGGWKKMAACRIARQQIASLPESDREILALFAGVRPAQSYGYYPYGSDLDDLPAQFQLLPPLAQDLLARICRTGRCLLRVAPRQEPQPLAWDDGDPWQFRLEIVRDKATWRAQGLLRRGTERMELSAPVLLLKEGLLIADQRIARLEAGEWFPWLEAFRTNGHIVAPGDAQEALLAELLNHPTAPPVDVPDELRYTEAAVTPRPHLKIGPEKNHSWGPDKLQCRLWFEYSGSLIESFSQGRGFFDPETRTFILRDRPAERAAVDRLRAFGLKFRAPDFYEKQALWELAPTKLPALVRELVQAGWDVEAEGKLVRRPGSFRMEVSSGIDWFDLSGTFDFDGAQASLPALLKALQRGESLVKLGDGSFGVLPEEWLRTLGPLPNMGTAEGDHIRFRKNQAGLLDAFLAARPEVSFDKTFARAREELRRFEGVQAAPQPEGFVGQLRGYQMEGVGWMHFLRQFGFGGCLADDMGVGKTAQVLALLETRRVARAADSKIGPSLVVVPKSLVFNWKLEAARFTPQLRVLDHTGLTRSAVGFSEHDLILTTYGTLRRDAAEFQAIEFDYVILDESQAIKNANTESAKAARLLNANSRLALSGTPIENHLGELWSLFEFLNPGMMGTAGVFKSTNGAMRNPDQETQVLLARALRPFILRRTKEQVAKELPRKFEQTLFCDMEPPQRRLYDELRDHFRATLLKRIDTNGMAKSKMHVLEALLRLRQAACHPGLIDPQRANDPSAKLDLLLMQLEDVLQENHKALVFSQFTSLLALVRARLDAGGVVYEYLDGQTRDRQARVERFQGDPDCKLFLVSLKAGGLGLNLTAAEYVFLLDPWWNPAVESQAIDRAHRIGQTRRVFAYRIIARDTVEEKVLELQNKKRKLADAIINADNSLMRGLGREDLELLLS